MDCHEPHGSSSEYLLRTVVNGFAQTTVIDDASGTIVGVYGALTQPIINIQISGYWVFFCSACHNITPHGSGGGPPGPGGPDWGFPCSSCHYHGVSPGAGNKRF